jgi:nitrogen regulatory protein PII
MKQIQAYIKPNKLMEVTFALVKVEGLKGVSVTTVKGFGRMEAEDNRSWPSMDELEDFASYAKIEIFCRDDLVDELINTIDKAAFTGLRGDGKIYVTDVAMAWKIGRGVI